MEIEIVSSSGRRKRRPAAFLDCIAPLLVLEEVQRLDGFNQHYNTSRLRHSLNVAYCGYVLSRALGLDFRAAARAGMLHDLFCYNWREEGHSASLHTYLHPKCALENAERLVHDLTDVERDAIAAHMWPLCDTRPHYMVSAVVSLADKICCVAEVAASGGRSCKRRVKKFFIVS